MDEKPGVGPPAKAQGKCEWNTPDLDAKSLNKVGGGPAKMG